MEVSTSSIMIEYSTLDAREQFDRQHRLRIGLLGEQPLMHHVPDVGRGVGELSGELPAFIARSTLLAESGLRAAAAAITICGASADFTAVDVNSYHAAVVADFIRQKLLASRATFTFETVMSARDKVDFLCDAKSAGYRTYLYYVATDDPLINVARLEFRSEVTTKIPHRRISRAPRPSCAKIG